MRISSILGSLMLLASSQLLADVPPNTVLMEYLRIQEALASDVLDGISTSASVIIKEAGAQNLKDKKTAAQVVNAATELSGAKTLKEARTSFKKLSAPIVRWTKTINPADVEVVHCSMVDASWVQKAGEVRNPYYGKRMLSCGEKKS